MKIAGDKGQTYYSLCLLVPAASADTGARYHYSWPQHSAGGTVAVLSHRVSSFQADSTEMSISGECIYGISHFTLCLLQQCSKSFWQTLNTRKQLQKGANTQTPLAFIEQLGCFRTSSSAQKRAQTSYYSHSQNYREIFQPMDLVSSFTLPPVLSTCHN